MLQPKRLDEILVQDITDAATVNRATFYEAVRWTIGSKPNASSKVARFRTRWRARKTIRDKAEENRDAIRKFET